MKAILILFLFFSFGSSLKAQVWIDSGAVWHYDYASFSPNKGFFKYTYASDTLIQGQFCQKIKSTSENFLYYGGDTLLYTGANTLQTTYTYVYGDTVFYWQNNQFYPLLNFGASVGDKWVISVDVTSDTNTSDTSEVIVTSVDSMLLNNQYYRTIVLQMNTCSKYHYEGTFIERFGLVSSSTNNLFPNHKQYSCPFDTMLPYHPIIYTFKCFKDESFALYSPSGQDCEYLLNILANEELAKQNWQLYPNPAGHVVQMTGSNITNKELVIFDILGQLVTKVTINSDSFNLSVKDLKTGVYFLMIEGSQDVRRLVVE